MNGYVKLTRAATIGGQTYERGEIVAVDRETGRELLGKRLAVPAAAPGRRCLTADSVATDLRPAVRGAR